MAASFGYGLAVSPYFAIRDVQIRAPDSALAKLALAGTEVPSGASTLLYPVQRIAEQLEDYPQIKQASIERALPGRLVVHVERREPVAAIKTRADWALVDAEGICVRTSDTLPEALMCCYGLIEQPLAPGEQLPYPQLRLLLETVAAVAAAPVADGPVMDFANRHLIEIHSPCGVLGKLGSPDNLRRKIIMFAAIRQQLEEKGHRPEYIDVRIMDRPVWKPQAG